MFYIFALSQGFKIMKMTINFTYLSSNYVGVYILAFDYC